MLVDCGLFQGLKELRQRTWPHFPESPGAVDAVVLIHPALDHVGCLPRLVPGGYAGRVFCTAGTHQRHVPHRPADSRRIQEEDARAGEQGHRCRDEPHQMEALQAHVSRQFGSRRTCRITWSACRCNERSWTFDVSEFEAWRLGAFSG